MKYRKFTSPQIAEAVFRGRKTPYSFEVYPLNIEFNPVPAVYIISRRKIDKYGRAHHQIVSLGQTESLAAEVKNQRRIKSTKERRADTVSVLLSDDEKKRLEIEEDLKAVYASRFRKPEINKPVFKVETLNAQNKTAKFSANTTKAENQESKLVQTTKAEEPKDNDKSKTTKPKASVQKNAEEQTARQASKLKTQNLKATDKQTGSKVNLEIKKHIIVPKQAKTSKQAEISRGQTVKALNGKAKSQKEKPVNTSRVEPTKESVLEKVKANIERNLKLKKEEPKSTKRSQVIKPEKPEKKTINKKTDKSPARKKAIVETEKGKDFKASGKTLKSKKRTKAQVKPKIDKKLTARDQKSDMKKIKADVDKKQSIPAKSKSKNSSKAVENSQSKKVTRNRLAI